MLVRQSVSGFRANLSSHTAHLAATSKIRGNDMRNALMNGVMVLLAGSFVAASLPVLADEAVKAAKEEAKAESKESQARIDQEKAQAQEAKGHPFRAARQAKRAEKPYVVRQGDLLRNFNRLF
jgi:cell envelope opacity-associated protein A